MKPSIRGRVTSFRWEGRDCGGRISESAQKKKSELNCLWGKLFFFFVVSAFWKTFEIFFENPTPKCWSLGQKDSGQTFVGDSSSGNDDVSPLHSAIGDPEIPLFHTLMVWIFWADREVQAGINEKEKDLRSCASFGWSLLGVNDRNWNLLKWHGDFRSSSKKCIRSLGSASMTSTDSLNAVLRTETSEARQVLKEQIALQAIPASVFQL